MRLSQTPATTIITVATVACYALASLSGMSEQAWQAGGFIPARVEGLSTTGALPLWVTPLTTTLLHGGLLHLGLNILVLIFCGRMVETVIGPFGLVALYVSGAYLSAAAQFVADPLDVSPMIGASGAISALFAAYAVLYGRPRLLTGHPLLAASVNILWLAAAWIGVQFLMGIAFAGVGMAVATAAHVGGFVAGLLGTRPLLLLSGR